MTASYGDICPACGSSDVTPYAVIVGGSEEYGYQCQVCQVTWPVLAHHDPGPVVAAVSLRHCVVRESAEGSDEDLEEERRHASSAARGRSASLTSSNANDSQPAASRA